MVETHLTNVTGDNLAMADSILFTVFTPTYNRKALLPRVYACLQKQTFREFEWIIIDDGSTDGTGEMVKQWQQEADFPIIYQWQPNQGKHVAYNAVAKLARGELFTSIDSDDETVPETLERLKYHWDNFTPEQKKTVGGIIYPGLDQNGKLVGDLFPKDYEIGDMVEMTLVNKITGDKGGMMQTKAFKMYPFPDNLNNVLVPEGSFIQRFAKDWKVCFINEPLLRIWRDERADHLSNQSSLPKNYPGRHYYYLSVLNYSTRLFLKKPKHFFGAATYYSQLSFRLNISLKKQLQSIRPLISKCLWFAFMPLGYLFYLRMRKREVK